MTSATLNLQPQQLQDSINLAYSSFSALALLLFDHALTMADEKRYIWTTRSPWSFEKTAFVICRYAGLANATFLAFANSARDPSYETCTVWKWANVIWFILSSFIPGNILLSMRLHRLHGNRRLVGGLLISTFFVETAAHLTIFSMVGNGMTIRTVPITLRGGIRGCFVETAQKAFVWVYMIPLPGLALSCLYLGLAISIFRSHLRHLSQLRALRAVRENASLADVLYLLYRDGVLIYAAIFGDFLFNIVNTATSAGRLRTGLGIPWLVIIYAISASRVLLTLRGDTRNDTGVYATGVEYRIGARGQSEYELTASKSSHLNANYGVNPC